MEIYIDNHNKEYIKERERETKKPNTNVPSRDESSAVGLEFDDEIRDSEISLLFQMSKNSGAEENLGLTDPVQVGVQLQSLDHLVASLLAVHESFGNDVGSEELVTLSELLEGDSIGEALSADTDALEDTVAPQLVEDKGGVDFSGSLLVIGNDATNEVGVRVSQGVHQLGQLFLVQLGDGPEHSLAGSGPELGVTHGLLSHSNDFSILPDCADELVLRRLELLDDVLVQRIHVLHQPLLGRVVDLSGVVDDRKVGLASEVGLHKLGVSCVAADQLLDEALVGRLREPALLVDQSHDAHRLK